MQLINPHNQRSWVYQYNSVASLQPIELRIKETEVWAPLSAADVPCEG